jgi:hypothetical protein
VQISSLKGDQISAQGFNPGLGNSRRCALKGHHNPARHYRIEIICARLFMLAPLSGRIFAWQVPRVETLGSALLPLRGADLVPFPYVDAHVTAPDARERIPAPAKWLGPITPTVQIGMTFTA